MSQGQKNFAEARRSISRVSSKRKKQLRLRFRPYGLEPARTHTEGDAGQFVEGFRGQSSRPNFPVG